MFGRIAEIILPVFLTVAVGWLYGHRVRPDMAGFNRIVIDVLCPLLVFSALSSKGFDLLANGWLLLGSLLVVLGSGLIAWPVARWLKEDTRTFVPPMMFNNCGNMGLPLSVLAFGANSLGPAAALFVTSNLLQFTLGARIVSGRTDFRGIARSPMVISTVVGVLFALLHITLPEPIALTVKLLGDATIPLMLFSLGVRMLWINLHGWWIGVVAAILCPVSGLLVALAVAPFLHLDARQYGLLMLFASMPPAVLNFLVAEKYRQEPDKVAAMVLFGNVGAIVFVPIGLSLGLG